MECKQSLVVAGLRLYPTQQSTTFIRMLPDEEGIPLNILKIIGKDSKGKPNDDLTMSYKVKLDDEDKKNMKKIAVIVKAKTKLNSRVSETSVLEVNKRRTDYSYIDDLLEYKENETSGANKNLTYKSTDTKERSTYSTGRKLTDFKDYKDKDRLERDTEKELVHVKDSKVTEALGIVSRPFLTTSDIDWLYSYLKRRKGKGDDVPCLHFLLEGANVEIPENIIFKRNPRSQLAGSEDLKAQQEALENYYEKNKLSITEKEVSSQTREWRYTNQKLLDPTEWRIKLNSLKGQIQKYMDCPKLIFPSKAVGKEHQD